MKFVNCTSHAAISINLSKVNPIQPEGRAGGGGGGSVRADFNFRELP